MFEWLLRLLARTDSDEHQRFMDTVDSLNAAAGGSEPVAINRFCGRLKIRSGTLVLGDPQDLPGLEVPNVLAAEVEISASIWRYPSGTELVTALRLGLEEPAGGGIPRRIGAIGIDSAKLVVADKDRRIN